MLIVAIPIMLQSVIYLSAWVFLTAFIKAYVLICVLIVMFITAFVLQWIIFQLDSKNKVFDAMIDGVPEEQREKESRRIFWTAIFTSWVSPVTVWSNNFSAENLKQKLGRRNTSKYFLFLTNCVSTVVLLIILIIVSYGILDSYQFR